MQQVHGSRNPSLRWQRTSSFRLEILAKFQLKFELQFDCFSCTVAALREDIVSSHFASLAWRQLGSKFDEFSSSQCSHICLLPAIVPATHTILFCGHYVGIIVDPMPIVVFVKRISCELILSPS